MLRTQDLIDLLRPFAERHAEVHRYHDSEPDNPPEQILVGWEHMQAAWEAVEEYDAAEGVD